jgi:type I restriction enzyme S subunit
MDVLLSIKPKYVEKIIEREKRFEFRKSYFKEDVDRVYIYSSAPYQEIIGYFKVGKVYIDTPEKVWRRCGKQGSISRQDFFEYFKGKDTAVGIEIDEVVLFEQAIKPYNILPKFVPPQSYYYLNPKLERHLKK